MKTSSGLFAALLTTVCMVAAPVRVAASGAPATTAVSSVHPLTLSAGGVGLSTAVMSHAVAGDISGGRLPGAAIPRSTFDPSDPGAWADGGDVSGWLAPASTFELAPSISVVENAYAFDSIDASSSVPLHAGDAAQVAIGAVRSDAPMPWNSVRNGAAGSLAWDAVTDARHITASYGGVTSSADVVLFRADLVARGGDVDARTAAVSAPTLTIPLPAGYSAAARTSHMASTFYPAAQYVQGLSMSVLPASATATLSASVRSYIPRAVEDHLADGTVVNEWHLTISGVIVISQNGTGGVTSARTGVSSAAGGLAVFGDGAGERSVRLGPGAHLVAGGGLGPRVSGVGAGAGGATAGGGGAVAGGAGDDRQMAEIGATNGINHQLSAAVDVGLGDGRYSATIDPNLRGLGLLGLENLRRSADGLAFVGVGSVPYARVDGDAVPLTAARLVDLRVLPYAPLGGIGFEAGGNDGSAAVVQSTTGRLRADGLLVSAVYDLGGSVYDFVSYRLAPDWTGNVLIVTAIPIALDGVRHVLGSVQYHEIAEAAPVVDATGSHVDAYTAPFDNSGSNGSLTAGSHTVGATVASAGHPGVLTVTTAPATLTSSPAADGRALGNGPLALFYDSPADAPAATSAYSIVTVSLPDTGTAPSAPPALGSNCGVPTMPAMDGPTSAASEPFSDVDIERAWLQEDASSIYATVQVTTVPSAAPAGQTLWWTVEWRHDHSGRFARALLDSTGAWSFDSGALSPLDGSMGTSTPATGSVQAGADGLIRIAVPRAGLDIRDGDLLRDDAAAAWVVPASGGAQMVDAAPEGSTAGWGLGADYVVGSCSTPATTLAEAPGGAAGLGILGGMFALGLGGARRRRARRGRSRTA